MGSLMDDKQWAARQTFLREKALDRVHASRFRVEVDGEIGSAYVQIRRGRIRRTVRILPSVNFDLDWAGRVVGIEII
jgi:hypothetical protein